jgi:hypothetical protein
MLAAVCLIITLKPLSSGLEEGITETYFISESAKFYASHLMDVEILEGE